MQTRHRLQPGQFLTTLLICNALLPFAQACTASGSTIFVEQVSHHPPVTAFHLQGPSGLFSFQGLSQPEVSFSAGGLKTNARGYRRITFASDGAVIQVGGEMGVIISKLKNQPQL